MIQIFEIAAPLAKSKANQTEDDLIGFFWLIIFVFSCSPIFLLLFTCERVGYHIDTEGKTCKIHKTSKFFEWIFYILALILVIVAYYTGALVNIEVSFHLKSQSLVSTIIIGNICTP